MGFERAQSLSLSSTATTTTKARDNESKDGAWNDPRCCWIHCHIGRRTIEATEEAQDDAIPPRQPPQESSRQFESHVGIADLDVVHNDGASDRGSRSGRSEQTQRLPGGRRYPLPIRFFEVFAGQLFAGVMLDNRL